MEFDKVAVPFVYLLIFYLGYPSQWMLMHLEPEPLSRNELILSNVLLACIFVTYTKSVFVDAGTIPKTEVRDQEKEKGKELGKVSRVGDEKKTTGQSRKWCRRCDAAKPPRAHHCKQCKRCIPKMDHHCPWTANCVSHTTFPHFIRFLFYASCGLGLLEYFLFIRISYLWTTRDLPAYLGPTPFQLTHIFITLVANSITLFGLFVLLIRNIWCLLVNTTTIEGWEIERHKTLVRRARHFGGLLEAPDGTQVRIQKQEFPYDIGFWANVKQGMGTGNPIAWFNPFHPTPPITTGLSFPTNEFNDLDATWPPPDPDRSFLRYTKPSFNASDAFTYQDSALSPAESLAAFRQRQAADEIRRRKPFVERIESKMARMMQDSGEPADQEYGHDDDYEGSNAEPDEGEMPWYSEKDGEEAWRNSEGERLKDFGVDEDVEFYDERMEVEQDEGEDDVPLGELMARKRVASAYADE